MSERDGQFKKRGGLAGIETAWSALVQQPLVSAELNRRLLEMANEPFSGHSAEGAAKETKFELASATWPEGEVCDVFLKPGEQASCQWLRTTAVSYDLQIGSTRTTVTVFAKPRGGLGAQYDSLRARLSEFYQPTAIINFSDLADYAETGLVSTDTIAAYWRDLGVALVAPDGRDLKTVYSLPPTEGPAIVCTNAEPRSKDVSRKTLKYSVLDIDGARVGFIALAEDPSAFYQELLPFVMREPVAAAREAVKELKEKEKTDLIVLLSRLDRDEAESVLAAVRDIDLFVSADAPARFSRKTVKMELNSWRRDSHGYPVYSAQLKTGRMTELLVEFNQVGDLKEPVLLEEKNTDEYAQADRFDNSYYSATDAYLERFFSSDKAILPEPRLLWPGASPPRHSYGPLELYSLAANALREKSGAEIAALRILPLPSGGTGAVTAARLEYWLRSQNDITLARLTGAKLKALLAAADFGALPSDGGFDYENNIRYAMSGLSTSGEIYGQPLRDFENYTVALPRDLYRKLGGTAVEAKKKLGLYELVSEKLQDEAVRSGVLPETVFPEYLASRNGGKLAVALPAALKRDLDALQLGEELDALWLRRQEEAQARFGTALAALARARTENKTVWRINLRELSFSFAQTQVSNTELYSAFSDARARASSQLSVKGAMRLFAESYTPDFRNDAGIIADYGKLRISPSGSAAVESETADRLQFVDDYMYRWRQLGGALRGVTMGPFMGAAYDTEFTPQPGTPFRKIIRVKG
ncbi:MAG TPA: hypothetical protein PLL10_04210, partial [Elusimicrobiales bacterium]|nr:hypothetical protein [Elusimicrobiales bacterium]